MTAKKIALLLIVFCCSYAQAMNKTIEGYSANDALEQINGALTLYTLIQDYADDYEKAEVCMGKLYFWPESKHNELELLVGSYTSNDAGKFWQIAVNTIQGQLCLISSDNEYSDDSCKDFLNHIEKHATLEETTHLNTDSIKPTSKSTVINFKTFAIKSLCGVDYSPIKTEHLKNQKRKIDQLEDQLDSFNF